MTPSQIVPSIAKVPAVESHRGWPLHVPAPLAIKSPGNRRLPKLLLPIRRYIEGFPHPFVSTASATVRNDTQLRAERYHFLGLYLSRALPEGAQLIELRNRTAKFSIAASRSARPWRKSASEMPAVSSAPPHQNHQQAEVPHGNGSFRNLLLRLSKVSRPSHQASASCPGVPAWHLPPTRAATPFAKD